MKIMYTWMGIQARTGGQAFGNTTFEVPAGTKYRNQAAMDEVSRRLGIANGLTNPATIVGCIELDQEGDVPSGIRQALTETLVGSTVDGDPWFTAGGYEVLDRRNGTFTVKDQGTFRISLDIERVEDPS